jgi:predicted DNA-binding protein
MTPEDTRRLEAIHSTVTSDGWKYLVEDIETKVESIKEEFTQAATNLELLRFGQGRLVVYREFASLRAIVAQILDNLALDAVEDSAEVNE